MLFLILRMLMQPVKLYTNLHFKILANYLELKILEAVPKLQFLEVPLSHSVNFSASFVFIGDK
jgi:hypothetical protein